MLRSPTDRPSPPFHHTLCRWLRSLPTDCRDAAVEQYLGIAANESFPAPSSDSPGDHLVGYHASGVDPILHALAEARVGPDDVVIDLGAGLGKVVFLAHLLTGATARGIELQASLVHRACWAASRLELSPSRVSFVHGDARTADLADGTLFFLYAPFTGQVLAEVLDRLREVARHHPIVVCALGIDLDRDARWLRARSVDAFWLTIYDST